MMVMIGLVCVVGLVVFGVWMCGGDGGFLGGRGASDGAATKRGECGCLLCVKILIGGVCVSVDLMVEMESWEVVCVVGVEDFTVSDSRLAGYSKFEVADVIKYVVEFVKKE